MFAFNFLCSFSHLVYKLKYMKKKVVVTGLGIVLPGSYSIESAWDNIVNSRSFISKIEGFDTSDTLTKIAAEIKWSNEVDIPCKPNIQYANDSSFIYQNLFNPASVMEKKEIKKMDKFILYAMHAANQAIEDAKLHDSVDKERVGVLVGSGIGGLTNIEETDGIIRESGVRRVSPFFIPSVLINLLSGQISMKYGYQGPNFSIVSACSTAAHAIGEGARTILCGDADVMIVGGAEAAICKMGIAGFNSLRALSTNFNNDPTKASRPWDKDRDGFVMGEGSGILVLEEYEHAKARGAQIYCELSGYGASGDAYHLTAPHPEGSGAILAMNAAIKKSGISLSEIDYINAHGTSTPMGDEIEIKSVQKLFAENCKNLAVSSTKSSTGHLLGAAGAIEAIFSICAIRDGIIPPTLNLDNPSEDCGGVNLVPHKAIKRDLNAVISNSFGFGGCNASLVFKKL